MSIENGPSDQNPHEGPGIPEALQTRHWSFTGVQVAWVKRECIPGTQTLIEIPTAIIQQDGVTERNGRREMTFQCLLFYKITEQRRMELTSYGHGHRIMTAPTGDHFQMVVRSGLTLQFARLLAQGHSPDTEELLDAHAAVTAWGSPKFSTGEELAQLKSDRSIASQHRKELFHHQMEARRALIRSSGNQHGISDVQHGGGESNTPRNPPDQRPPSGGMEPA